MTSSERPANADGATAAAMALKLSMPTTGLPAARPIPRAAASAMRIPVKLPGPTPTAILASASKARPASAITSITSGINAWAWPRAMGASRQATLLPSARMASEQAAAEASKARTGPWTAPLTAWPFRPGRDTRNQNRQESA
jgi:hypothetical protein